MDRNPDQLYRYRGAGSMLTKNGVVYFQRSTGGLPVSIEVEIARDSGAHLRGLAGETFLGGDEGMLFVFDHAEYYPFWMKDVLISLDMVFADARGRIVTTYRDVHPRSESVYRPSEPAALVVEVCTGFLGINGIREGDQIHWKLLGE